eukprot:Rhum_TRINITY_DN10899_c0_g1::Rhum_TRINITY_DN10899_c0_g1_i1::g.40945::m.40945/K08957/CSNK1A; casein kinase 1, alpha
MNPYPQNGQPPLLQPPPPQPLPQGSQGVTKAFRETIVAGKFKLLRKIGAGSFGEIFQALNESTGDMVAMKVESSSAKYPQLLNEALVYKSLNEQGQLPGVPRLHWYGTEGDFNVMVLDLLGPSLEDLFVFCNRKFSVKTVLLLADQMLTRIEHLHRHKFIHRDIKPDNFLLGQGRRGHIVYSIDLGLCKRFYTHQHIPYKEGKSLAGTARYVSINTHNGFEQSRRDDIESIGYVLLYFLRGGLPWQNVKVANKKEKYEQISQRKSSCPVERLCQGLPKEFANYLNYARSLKFEDEPAYDYLRAEFRRLYDSHWKVDYEYDWVVIKRKMAQQQEKRQRTDRG